MRSNGHAFILETWELAQKSKRTRFNFVYLDEFGKLAVEDQAKALVRTLPDEVVLSRGMSAKEATLWRKGKTADIVNNPEYRGAGSGRERSYFALNYYRFSSSDEPYLIRVPRAVLEKLEADGRLQISSYDSMGYWPQKGMPPQAQLPIGLEVELVILDPEGRAAIYPFARDSMVKLQKPAGDVYRGE